MLRSDSNIVRVWSQRLLNLWQQHQVHRWSTLTRPRLLTPEQPAFVRDCSITMRALPWLRLLDWKALPLPGPQHWYGREPVPMAAYIGAFLVKLDQGLPTIGHLHRFLLEHPALIWALGFPLVTGGGPYGFDPGASLPTPRYFTEVLRQLPQPPLQKLLDGQVNRLRRRLPESFGQTISLDTKHVIAWVKENNSKQYIKEGRFDKTQQPAGDPDCKVGCKRRHNRIVIPPTTPTKEGQPGTGLSVSVGEFYWGYASGIVVTKVEGWGEFVLAELTQTFDNGDPTYFFPLLEQVEQRLGFRPRYGTADAAFDAFYVYDYFHSPEHDGFAAVPLNAKGGKPTRSFAEDGSPLCEAELPMSLKFTFTDRTSTLVEHQRAKYACPLLHPEANGKTCPIHHKLWEKGGCTTHLADSPGARIRHQLDRESDTYRNIYRQRTATERIFAQAVALGIERPKLRNQQAITNQNTLTYLLINLRAMQRVLALLAK